MAEAAQPVYSAYWLHNKGAAPLGYQPVTVRIRPAAVVANGPFALPVSVASEQTDEPVAGMLRMSPSRWLVGRARRTALPTRTGCSCHHRDQRLAGDRWTAGPLLRGRPDR